MRRGPVSHHRVTMDEFSVGQSHRVAVVDVFVAQGGSGLRVGVCSTPFGPSIERCDRDWCDEVRQRFGLAVLLINGSLAGPRRDPRLIASIRGFDRCGEMSPSMVSTMAGLVSETVLHAVDPRAGVARIDAPAAFPDPHGRVSWVPLHGLSTCRVRRSLLAPIGVALGLHRSDVDFALPSVVASQDRSTLIIPVRDYPTVQSLEPDCEPFAKVCAELGLAGCFVYAPTASRTRVVARMVMPGLGAADTIANPVAAGALAKVLIAQGLLERTMTLRVEQLGPNGGSAIIEIIVEAQPRSRKVWAGGRTHFAGWRTLQSEAAAAEPAA